MMSQPPPSYPQPNYPPMGIAPRPHAIGYVVGGLAVGVAVTVLVFFALGGHLGGTSSTVAAGCPTSTEASIGSANDTGPSATTDSVSVHSDTWAAGATDSVVTHPMWVAPDSTLLVFVGWIGGSIGGPFQVSVCDSSGDSFFLQTSTSVISSNHSQAMFLAFDAHGGSTVSFAANFSDTDASAGGVVSVVDLSSAAALSLNDLVIGDTEGYTDSATVNLSATTTSFLVLSVTGQGNAAPYTTIGSEMLLASNGYYDTGPWGDGESFGTMVGTTSSGTVAPGAHLAGVYVWNAIAVLVD
jgi:hypothetical protein